MDRVRTELFPPVYAAERHREARRQALADLAAPPTWPGPALAAHLGALLVWIGCRLEAAGRRHMSAAALMTTPLACSGGELSTH